MLTLRSAVAMPIFALLVFAVAPHHSHQTVSVSKAGSVSYGVQSDFESVAELKALPGAVQRHRYRQELRVRRARIATWRSSSESWANSPDAIKVANCESGGARTATTYQGDVHDPYNPSYRGKWQMGYAEWAYFGGHGDPAVATEAEQDYRAWQYWMRSGWRPWQCASIMGVS